MISACQNDTDKLISINGSTMGTTYSMRFIKQDKLPEKKIIHTTIEKTLTDINQSMSTYISNSELSLFNQSSITEFQSLSNELFNIIEYANQISEISHGAFDITVGPLVNLWGFGSRQFNKTPPSNKEIKIAKKHTGYNKILFDKTLNSIAKTDPNIYIDLSGIAKGYAVDKIASYFNMLNIKNYLIEIGGELIAKGTNTKNTPWQIGVEQAIFFERKVQRMITLNNMAMATSGDYRNYFEKNGTYYSHMINPVTGKPVTHGLASVTVIDDSAMHADAMTTAFMVLGPNKSMALAERLKIPVYMIIRTEKKFDEYYNDLFSLYFSD